MNDVLKTLIGALVIVPAFALLSFVGKIVRRSMHLDGTRNDVIDFVLDGIGGLFWIFIISLGTVIIGTMFVLVCSSTGEWVMGLFGKKTK